MNEANLYDAGYTVAEWIRDNEPVSWRNMSWYELEQAAIRACEALTADIRGNSSGDDWYSFVDGLQEHLRAQDADADT